MNTPHFGCRSQGILDETGEAKRTIPSSLIQTYDL